MLNKFKRLLFCLAAVATALCVAGCKEEIGTGEPGGSDANQVIFTVGGVEKIETKSGTCSSSRYQRDRIALSEPGDPEQLFLVETVEDMDETLYSTEIATKGTPVYTETFANTYKNFSTIPYRDNAKMTTGYKSLWSGLIQASQNRYAFDFTDGWPGDEDILFFMGAPANLNETENAELGYSNLTLDPEKGTIEFDYASPVIAGENGGAAHLEDASVLQDLLFTCKNVTKSEYKGNGAKILFYHTLAGVKFKSGNAVREGTKTADGTTDAKLTSITKVQFVNIRTSGHCTLTPNQSYNDSDSNVNIKDGVDIGDVPKSSVAANWTNISGTATFSISPKGLVSNDGQFPTSTDFEGTTISGNTDKALGQLNINSSNFDQTFMFVPQETGNQGDVILTIEYTIDGKKFRKSVNFGKRTWEAGKLYTYTLSANHVGVKVRDQLDPETGKVKSNVVITNTGNVDEYIRAAIVGNWYDSHSVETDGEDQIVCPWDPADENQGIMNGKNANWIYSDPANGGDGYYYYKYKVAAGVRTQEPIFTSFTVGTCPMALYGGDAHLEMDILVQAIDASWKDGSTKENAMKGFGWKMDNFATTYHPSYNPGTKTTE